MSDEEKPLSNTRLKILENKVRVLENQLDGLRKLVHALRNDHANIGSSVPRP